MSQFQPRTGALRIALFLFASLLVSASFSAGASEDGHHRHHLAIAAGYGWHDSKNSAFAGADYVYFFNSRWGLGAFYEEVNGDFDLQAWGILAKRRWNNGFEFAFGPGYEYKLEHDKTLFLFRLQGGYNWHAGQWSFGPVLTTDLIEDGNTTYYAGVTVGFGW